MVNVEDKDYMDSIYHDAALLHCILSLNVNVTGDQSVVAFMEFQVSVVQQTYLIIIITLDISIEQSVWPLV